MQFSVIFHNDILSLVKKPFILLHRVYGIDLYLLCVVERDLKKPKKHQPQSNNIFYFASK